MAKFKGTAAANTIYGTSLDDILDGGEGADTLIGGLGNDTYIIDNIGDKIVEKDKGGIDTLVSSLDIDANSLSSGFAFIENFTLTGTSDLNVLGNRLGNKIIGNSGNNTVSGFDGNDTIFGGAGDDSLSAADDQLLSQSKLKSSYLDGGDGNDTLTGAYGNNTIIGGNGNDTIRTVFGTNVLNGGAGDDTYFIFNFNSSIFTPPAFAAKVAVKNTITEGNNGGIDTLNIDFDGGTSPNISYTLIANIEILDTSRVIETNLALTGNLRDNTITGGALNDTINGGLGIDSLVGGTGDDTYVIDNTLDNIAEFDNEGIDTVLVSNTSVGGTYFIDATFIENVTLINKVVYNVSGNNLANEITGNAANNALYGRDGDDQLFGSGGNDYLEGGIGNDYLDGGIGADRYDGGSGDDTYVFDNAGDIIQTADSSGIDTIIASTGVIKNGFNTLDLNLSNDPLLNIFTNLLEIENVTLTGKLNIGVAGNALDNNIFGNDGKNDINGFDGNDYIDGGAGNDSLVGNSGFDTLNGGLGNDTLRGGAGDDDFFLFDTALSATNVDLIKDLSIGDLIYLDDAIFKGLDTIGPFLNGNDFETVITGSNPLNVGPRIVYNTTTQTLYYDADGANGVAAIAFAKLEGVVSVDAGIFEIV